MINPTILLLLFATLSTITFAQDVSFERKPAPEEIQVLGKNAMGEPQDIIRVKCARKTENKTETRSCTLYPGREGYSPHEYTITTGPATESELKDWHPDLQEQFGVKVGTVVTHLYIEPTNCNIRGRGGREYFIVGNQMTTMIVYERECGMERVYTDNLGPTLPVAKIPGSSFEHDLKFIEIFLKK